MRYLLFAGHCYYPLGGIDDLKGTFDTEQDAWDCLNRMTIEEFGGYVHETQWFQIVLMDENGLRVIKDSVGYKPTSEGWCDA